MELRIHRSWSWVLDCSQSEVVYGGRNPMKLVAHDVLQYRIYNEDWRNVEIVEGAKPEHPEDKRNRERMERLQYSPVFDLLKNNKLPPTLDKLVKNSNGIKPEFVDAIKENTHELYE